MRFSLAVDAFIAQVPYGYCHCGCGEKTKLAPRTATMHGWVKGEPLRFVRFHQGRVAGGKPGVGRPKKKNRYKVDPETGCWIWLLAVNQDGYAMEHHRGKTGVVHRRHYVEAHGPIPEGLELDHLCRNRACVNPDHLEAVTHRENIRRGWRARRAAA